MSRNRFPIAVVFALLLSFACARAVESGNKPPAKIYRDKIKANWFSQGNDTNCRFWYRLETPGAGREFVVVDAVAGTRRPAFDHARLAAALGKLLRRQVDARHLPVETLRFDQEGNTIHLRGASDWKLDLESYQLTPESGAANEPTLPATAEIHPSRNGGGETHIIFINRTREKASVFWIDPDGKRVSYGSLLPDERREQQTYDGHVWLVTTAAGDVLAVFDATEKPAVAVVDESTRPGPRRRNRSERKARAASAKSPDGKWEAVVHEQNLFLRDAATGNEYQLTSDGNPTNTYARNEDIGREIEMEYERRDPATPMPEVYWSPDSRHLAAMRLTPGAHRKVYLVESSPEDQLQPKLQSYPYLKPGDAVPIRKPHLFDAEAKKEIPVDDALFQNPWATDDLRWSTDSSRFTFLFNQRGHQVLRIVAVDADTGHARAIVEERSKTFICYSSKFLSEYLDETGEIIWMSERDGWNHLYLYDARTGLLKNQITQGQWVVRNVERVDKEKRQIWFYVGGIRPGQDPYYAHLCRVNFDGSGLAVLTGGDGTHTVEFSPDRRWFIDSWSRVDFPPAHELRRAEDGRLVCQLESADVGEWEAAGGKMPERFAAKGRDGVTDIYGVIWRPKNFKPRKKYPVIEDIYAGPQDSFVPKSFHSDYPQQKLADRGFIVVQIDGMGTSNRSKKFHDVCWKNLADAGFPDRILWIKAAAAKYRCMDLARVGIYGGSAGGQNALRGLLDHGDFYKAGVADSGCHDNRMDKIWWNEQWMGWPVDESYVRSSNVADAHKLNGRLLLMWGEMDRNVDPSSSTQVANALIKAGKDFEMLEIPGAGHGVARTPYGARRLEEFFVRNFLGAETQPAATGKP